MVSLNPSFKSVVIPTCLCVLGTDQDQEFVLRLVRVHRADANGRSFKFNLEKMIKWPLGSFIVGGKEVTYQLARYSLKGRCYAEVNLTGCRQHLSGKLPALAECKG